MKKNIECTDDFIPREGNEEIQQDKIDKALALLDQWMKDLEQKYESE